MVTSVYDKVRPVLEASFSNVMYTGGIGTAMIPKVVLMTKSGEFSVYRARLKGGPQVA